MTPAQPTASPWQLFSVEEAAEILHLHRGTIYRLLKHPRNPLPHHNIMGTGVKFTAGDLDKILADSARGRQ